MTGKRFSFLVLLFTAGTCIFGQFYTGDGGRGIVIAVPTPVMQNPSRTNNWIPQLFQDIITGDMARFSALTVLDRKNESLALAEQQLSANGNYSDVSYIRMGNMTNARYIVAGSINNTSGRYHVNFRVNNTETNEIRTSFNKQYVFDQIENGFAAKETTFELLKGLGITLTADGERQLLALQNTEVRSTVQLAKGMAAIRNDSVVDALSYLYQASEAGSNRQEALSQLGNLSFTISTGSIRERANAAFALQEKWKKIIADLETYLINNSALCLVYDLGKIQDKIDYDRRTVNLTISPGVQIVGNRTVVLVYQRISSEFEEVKNEEFMKGIRFPPLPIVYRNDIDNTLCYSIKYGLYDDMGDKIAENRVYFYLAPLSNSEAISQSKFFSSEGYAYSTYGMGYSQGFQKLNFDSISLNSITDVFTTRIENLSIRIGGRYSNNYKTLNIPWYTPSEWQEWISQNNSTNQANVPTSSNSFSLSGNSSSNTPTANAATANTAESRTATNKTAIENLLREYGPNLFSSGKFQLGNAIPAETIANAMASYALVRSRSDIIAVLDDAILSKNRGKTGFAFTAEGAYFSWSGGATGYIRYADFERLEVIKEIKKRDPISAYLGLQETEEEKIKITMRNTASAIELSPIRLRADQFRNFLQKARDAVR